MSRYGIETKLSRRRPIDKLMVGAFAGTFALLASVSIFKAASEQETENHQFNPKIEAQVSQLARSYGLGKIAFESYDVYEGLNGHTVGFDLDLPGSCTISEVSVGVNLSNDAVVSLKTPFSFNTYAGQDDPVDTYRFSNEAGLEKILGDDPCKTIADENLVTSVYG